ncbi:glutathione S-transferase family protein [Methylocapsa palsarum]|uniref:Glutathione S-transferase n=1 Tax=Methylocapsa palsarum TaxID=1612308 RepID=A0A1I3Z3Y6_9HYPH|nr:glutathione S-transferase N-terminal domain-containing protein [Methylocapsa palsarum]SFK38765.1 Glutathione S-transferase [Methylocapsa palsarum]
MMTLLTSPASPFGRKVVIAAALAGLSGQIKAAASDTSDPDDPVRSHNPLGKIPTLILDDGSVLFDSRVIVEYLDVLAGGDILIPAAPEERFKSLTLAALADGIADASLLQMYEVRFRDPSRREPGWMAHQEDKVARGLKALDAAPPAGRRDVAHIAAACALGYLDLRFEGAWRDGHPSLVRWLDGFASDVPSFEATRL